MRTMLPPTDIRERSVCVALLAHVETGAPHMMTKPLQHAFLGEVVGYTFQEPLLATMVQTMAVVFLAGYVSVE